MSKVIYVKYDYNLDCWFYNTSDNVDVFYYTANSLSEIIDMAKKEGYAVAYYMDDMDK